MYRHILVATDGSGTARLAVDRAVEVAKALGSELTIFSVGTPAATQVVEAEMARLSDSGVKVNIDTAEGDPAGAIVDRSERGDVDLLVVGNKGMTGPSRFLLGSVPNKVSHHAPIALLIVRTT